MSSVKSKGTTATKATAKKQLKHQSEPGLIAPDAWINEVADIKINDNEWSCNVVIIEETSPTASVYLDHFNDAAVNGNRIAVKTISRVEVVEFVKKTVLRGQNKKITPIELLCKEIYTDVGPDFEKMIPTSLLAHLLVYIILEYKDLNKKIRKNMEDKNKELEEYRESLWPPTNTKTASSKSGKTGIKSNLMGKGGKVQAKTKVYTKLRKRGEEWKDTSWISDSPIDGPQLYIAVSNFYDSSLPLELLKLRVPLTAIIELSLKLSSNPNSKNSSDLLTNLTFFSKKYSQVLQSRSRSIDEEKRHSWRTKFWREINTMKNKLPTSLMFKNIMFLQFLPDNSLFGHEIKAFQEEIYRQISHFMFDIYENRKLHKAHSDALKVTDIPDDFINFNMNVYNSILDIIPHEVLSIACILEAILTQVCDSEINEQTQERDSSVQLAGGTTDSILRYIERLNIEYDLHLRSNIVSTSDLETYSKSTKQASCKITKVLAHSDDVSVKTFHLEEKAANFIINRTKHILKTAWKDFWAKYFVQNDNDYNFINLCNEIIKSENKFEQHALYYYVYLLIVNCILNSVLMQINFDGHEDGTRFTMRYDSNQEKMLFNKADLCDDCIQEIGSIIITLGSYEQRDSKGIPQSGSSYSLTAEIISSNLFHIEDMSSDILLQNLQAVFSEFSKFETRYCPFTEQLVIVFHNLYSTGPVHEETWVGKITTDVPERDFVEYVLEEEAPWFDSYIRKTLKQPPLSKIASCLPENRVEIPVMILLSDSQFLSHRSLKYEQLMKEQLSRKSPTVGFTNHPFETDKTIHENDLDRFDPCKQQEVEFKKDSVAQINSYNLGEPQRFQFTGLVKEKLLEDYTKITLHQVQKLYGDTSNVLHVTINGHTLYYNYEPTSDSITPFHIHLSSGIILYFGLPSFMKNDILKTSFSHEDEPLTEIPEAQDVKSNTSNSLNGKLSAETPDSVTAVEPDYDSVKFPHEIKEANFHKIPSAYDFKMSTPSGLHVELVKLQHKGIFHVRQTLLSKGYKSKTVQQEEFRCYTSTGHIIKFMLGGEIEVLVANGALCSIYEVKDLTEDHVSVQDIRIGSKMDSTEKDKLSVTDKTTKSKNKKHSKKNNKKQETKKSMDQKVFKTDSDQLSHALKQSLETESHLKLVDYKYTSSDGKRHVVKGSITETMEDLLMIASSDISSNSINSERLDGLTSTHHADGSLTVYFSDESCITSIPIETEEIFCEWNTTEFDLWFCSYTEDTSSTTVIFSNQHSESNHITNNNHEDSVPASTKNSFPPKTDSKVLTKYSEGSLKNTIVSILHENSLTLTKDSGSIQSVESDRPNAKLKPKNKIIYSEDGFVVYSLNYLLEHPNYTSIYFDSSKCEVEFNSPFSSSVSLKSDGSFQSSFDGANLIIENGEIYFNRLNENGNISRVVAINSRGPVHVTGDQVKTERQVSEAFTESINLSEPEIKEKLFHSYSMNSHLLYSVNELGNQVFVDFDLNMYEIVESKVWYGVREGDLCCFVINKDLSGFKLTSDLEANQHVQFVRTNRGLVRKSENIWSSLLTSLPMLQNESEKWLMKRRGTRIKTNIRRNVSTFGRRESWAKPFVIQETSDTSLTESDVVIARILNKIPTEGKILSELKSALEEFRGKIRSSIPITISINSTKGDLELREIINDPSILCQIYEEESGKAVKENDGFRNDMRNAFLRSLIRQACIKARRNRQNIQVEEFKRVLRTKQIPPYHLSCFGQVHSIMDEVLENVNMLRKTPSGFERVRSIIDEILNLATTSTETDSDKADVIQKVISEIFGNFCELSKVNSYQNLINSILEKPLATVTTEEVKLLCRAFESGSGDCPILYDEGVVLKDVLEARYELSHYFGNLKELLQYYRDHVLSRSSCKKNDCEEILENL